MFATCWKKNVFHYFSKAHISRELGGHNLFGNPVILFSCDLKVERQGYVRTRSWGTYIFSGGVRGSWRGLEGVLRIFEGSNIYMSARVWGGHIVCFPILVLQAFLETKPVSCMVPSAIRDSRLDLIGVLGGSWMGFWGGLGGCWKGFGGVWRGLWGLNKLYVRQGPVKYAPSKIVRKKTVVFLNMLQNN